MIVIFILAVFLNFQVKEEGSIEKLQLKFENIYDLEADFVQSSNNKNLMKGKFYFSQKDNYRIELKNNIIISDGVSIWNRDKKRKKVIISSIDDDPLAFSLREYIYNYPAKCDISEQKIGNNLLLTLKAKDTNLNFKSAKLWINRDFLINKIEVLDFSGNSFLFEFRNIKINRSLDNKLFTFNDDGTYKIIDLR